MSDPLEEELKRRGILPGAAAVAAPVAADPLLVELQKRGIDPNSPQGISATLKETAPASIPEKVGFGAGDIWHGLRQSSMRAPPIEPYTSMNDEMAIREQAAAGAPVVDKQIAEREKAWQDRRKLNNETGPEWARGAGAVVASAPLAALVPELGAGIPGAIATGAAQGLVQAGVSPVTSGDFNAEKSKQNMFGAGSGAATGLVTGGIRQMLSPAPKSPKIQDFIDKGGRPTFGQSIGPRSAQFEDKLTSVPGLGDLIKDSQRIGVESFNKTLYNRALAPLGEKYEGEAGHAGVRKVGDLLSAAYDKLVPDLKLTPDENLAAGISEAVGIKARMTKSAAKQLDDILKDIVPKGKAIEGEALKDLQSQLTYEIGRFGKSPDPSNQMIADALDGVQAAIMKNLADTNPAHAAQLKAIDTGWATLVRLERAAANSKGGVFTPEAFLQAVKASDDSVRKRAVARGTAFLQDVGEQAYEIMGNKYPDSGSPGRALASAAALGWASPQALIGGVAGSIPYLPGLRNGNLTSGARPAWAAPAANAVKRIGPAVNGALIFGARPQ